MKLKTKIISFVTSCLVAASAATAVIGTMPVSYADNSKDISNTYDWGTLKIGGGGFVSGIVAGQKEMYLRTDVGGVYKYNYTSMKWEQLFGFINDADKGLLSVKGMAIDPTDDNIVYFLCGCAYFSDTRTEVIKTTDGGKTFERHDVTDMIQVHGNGDGRECIEPIAVDPDNPDVIYAGGDVSRSGCGLIKSTDGGKTWKDVEGYKKLGLFSEKIKYPMWTEDISMGTENIEYNKQNGIGVVFIEDGKVYVGTSVTGQTNIHVADVTKDEFAPCSKDLPTENYPLSITSDKNGNIFFTYIAGLAFSGMAGGAYKYEKASGKVTKLSVSDNAIGMIEVSPDNPDHLLARTCGVWGSQLYEKWTENSSPAWGDQFFRSTDGGETWQEITPGKEEGPWGEKWLVSNYMGTNGYDWIYGKACHWGSSIILDPRNSDHIYLTSGNGVFRCDNVWDEKGVQFYFDPDGVEEVVALDMVSAKGAPAYSAIGDYDGFVHEDVDKIPLQHQPNMGSTSTIGCCSANPKVLVRGGKDQPKGYYTTDGGVTWTEMNGSVGGGDHYSCDIAKIDDDTYRVFSTNASGIKFTDDFGATWTECKGTVGTKPFGVLVDKEDNSIVYAYTAKYNEYWASDMTKKEPTLDDAQYDFMISTDGGKTFTNQILCPYDQCDIANKLAYLEHDNIIAAAGWNGLYQITNSGKTVEKLDVFYCKTVGYGAPEKEGGVNTLYMYGKPQESDPEGIYRSTDAGKTWACINTDHLYGGTGNGNFLVGDMNEFGMVYMSTVGCGIVYGRLSDSPKPPKPTEATTEKPTEATTEKPTEATTEKPTEATTEKTTEATTNKPTEPTGTTTTIVTETLPTGDFTDLKYGDVNLDGAVTGADTVKLAKYMLSKETYPLGKGDDESEIRAKLQADVKKNNSLETSDTMRLNEYNLKNITEDVLGTP